MTSEQHASELAEALASLPNEGSRTGSMQTVPWEDFRGNRPIFNNLVNIRRFALILDLAPIPELAESSVSSRLATSLYSLVLQAIEDAGFYQQEHLVIHSTSGISRVVYGDDRFDFEVTLSHNPEENSRQGQLTISRDGSLMSDFHSWYVAMSPQFSNIIDGSLRALGELTQRSIRAFRGAFQFRFLLHDFHVGDASVPIRNYDIMGKLVRGVPGDDGRLSENPDVIRSAGRTDVALSRWVRAGDIPILERYTVEAPANKEGAGLWLNFSYNGETLSLAEAREPFDLSKFIGLSQGAYVSFLRDKALGTFLAQLLADTSFRSATATLP